MIRRPRPCRQIHCAGKANAGRRNLGLPQSPHFPNGIRRFFDRSSRHDNVLDSHVGGSLDDQIKVGFVPFFLVVDTLGETIV